MKNTQNTYELTVLVGGRPVTEYAHENNTFVEGRKGSDFEVRFSNRTHKRVLVVPAVDGRSVLDGMVATPESRGYIVGPFGVLNIPGWTLDNDNVAKFTFEDKEKSYAAATAQGEVVQSGVIGVLVYGEVEKPTPIHHYHHYIKSPTITPWPYTPAYPYNTLIGAQDSLPQNLTKGLTRGLAVNNAASSSSNTFGATPLGATAQSSATMSTSDVELTSMSDSFEMGAGFGDKQEFKTTNEQFERSALQAQMSLYYDSRRNLEKRGIVVVRKETAPLPQAFAGTGCKPPEGWQG